MSRLTCTGTLISGQVFEITPLLEKNGYGVPTKSSLKFEESFKEYTSKLTLYVGTAKEFMKL